MGWLKPTVDIVNHRYVLILYEIVHEEGDKEGHIDIFTFNGIYNYWSNKGKTIELKFKDIILWYPIPEIPKLRGQNVF